MAGQTITMTEGLTALSRLMGKRSLPQGDNSDWEDYVQEAFNYAWRYYRWDWSMRVATIDLSSNAYMPDDFDIGGFREALADQNGTIAEVTIADYYRLPSGIRNFAIEWDATVSKYKVVTNSGLGSFLISYQAAPPDLSLKDENGTDRPAPFPSVQAIGMGASIWAKQGENPTRADVKQEWDMFHHHLNRIVGNVSKNTQRSTNLNLQDYYDTYTGDTRR